VISSKNIFRLGVKELWSLVRDPMMLVLIAEVDAWTTPSPWQSTSLPRNAYIQQIVASEVNEFVQRYRSATVPPVELALRMRFNPNLEQSWFGSLMEIINNVTMLSIILTGAALIREREHGTIEHLLVMPVTPAEIMLAKVWSMGLVVLLAALVALVFVVQGALRVPIQGSVALFIAGCRAAPVRHHLDGNFPGDAGALDAAVRHAAGPGVVAAANALGRRTPYESMPELVQNIMLAAPTTHFVSAGQAILYRGAGIDVVWPQFLAIWRLAASCSSLH
jgi:ABC-2 type transport system permease protein